MCKMNEIIEKGLAINPSMKLNPDEEHVKRIMIGIEKKDGHCACVLTVNDDYSGVFGGPYF